MCAVPRTAVFCNLFAVVVIIIISIIIVVFFVIVIIIINAALIFSVVSRLTSYFSFGKVSCSFLL